MTVQHEEVIIIGDWLPVGQIMTETLRQLRGEEDHPVPILFAVANAESTRLQIHILQSQIRQFTDAHPGVGQGKKPGPVEGGIIGIIARGFPNNRFKATILILFQVTREARPVWGGVGPRPEIDLGQASNHVL